MMSQWIIKQYCTKFNDVRKFCISNASEKLFKDKNRATTCDKKNLTWFGVRNDFYLTKAWGKETRNPLDKKKPSQGRFYILPVFEFELLQLFQNFKNS